VVLDKEGCGSSATALHLETELDARLREVWGAEGKALVIEPELDVWMWGAENSLQTLLLWNKAEPIRQWLSTRGFVFDDHHKPLRPKEAWELVLKELNTPRSSALYEELAGRFSLRRCSDPAFRRLRKTLQTWFPVS